MSVLESNLEKIKDKIKDCKLLTDSILGISIPEEPEDTNGLLYKYNSDLLDFTTRSWQYDTGVNQSDLVNGYTIIIRHCPTNYVDFRALFGRFYNSAASNISGEPCDYPKAGIWRISIYKLFRRISICTFRRQLY